MSQPQQKKIIFFAVMAAVLFIVFFSLVSNITPSGKFITQKTQAPLEIDQTLIKILLKAKESAVKPIRIMNVGDSSKTVRIDCKNLDDMISFSEKEFSINPGQAKTVELNFSSSSSNKDYTPGIYVGKIVISTGNYVQEIPVIVEVESKEVLFDMNINVQPEDRRVTRGKNVDLGVKLFNLAGIKPASVNMEYFVKDLDGNTIITEQESVVIETQVLFSKTLHIPSNMKPGSYIFAAKSEYGSSVGTSSYLFEVVEPEKPKNIMGQIIIYSTLVILIIGLFILAYRRYMKRREEIKIQKENVDLNKRIKSLEERIKKLGKKRVDVKELETDLKLIKLKIKKGMIKIAERYMETLDKKLSDVEKKGK